jgi:transposase
MHTARTNTNEGLDVTSQRRSYSPEFKADILRQISAGIPVARIALKHQINPVTVHRWRRETRQKPVSTTPGFIPVALGVRTDNPVQDTIGLEFNHRDIPITVHWPLSASAQCVHMLRELLQ